MGQANARRSKLIYALCAFALCFIALALAANFGAGTAGGGGGTRGGRGLGLGGGHIALISVEGPISASGASGGMLGGAAMASSVALCEQLYEAQGDDAVKGVLLRINSPGGSAAASDEIYRAVMALRKAGKPVVVSMGDVAASGGYYIASAANYIYANGATLTGSIGVIFELMNWDKAAEKLGIESETLHAGEFKDIGSPWRDMTGKEREMLSTLLAQVHGQFIKAVDEGRDTLDEAGVRKLATGMIYTGEDAAKVGLVDAVGGFEDAKLKVRALAGLPADAEIEEYGGGGFWEQIFSMRAPPLSPEAMLRRAATGGIEQIAQGLCLNTTLRDLMIR